MTARLQVSGSKLALTRPSTKIKAGNVSTVNVIADKLDVPNNEKAIDKGRLLHCGHFRSNTISTLTARALTESVTQMRMKSSLYSRQSIKPLHLEHVVSREFSKKSGLDVCRQSQELSRILALVGKYACVVKITIFSFVLSAV